MAVAAGLADSAVMGFGVPDHRVASRIASSRFRLTGYSRDQQGNAFRRWDNPVVVLSSLPLVVAAAWNWYRLAQDYSRCRRHYPLTMLDPRRLPWLRRRPRQLLVLVLFVPGLSLLRQRPGPSNHRCQPRNLFRWLNPGPKVVFPS